MELIRAMKNEFSDIYGEMTRAFPREELREPDDALETLDDPLFRVYHTVRDGKRIGFITLWELDGFFFAEHFVTYGEHRGRGYGAEVIELLKKKFGNIVLECEHPDTPLAKRRLAFYERCGFKRNSYPYVQPSYRAGEAGVPLVLMSCPETLKNVTEVIRTIYKAVYHKDFDLEA